MRRRRAAGWKLTAGLAVWLGLFAFAFGQFGREPTPDDDGLPPAAMIVPPGRETLQALNHAREALKQGQTADGIQLLQRLIELPEDYFTDSTMQHTLKSETLQILASLTPEQRKSYDLLRGKAAAALLDDAKAAGDAERMADVARRFPLTAASIEATQILALAALDQGRPWQAAVQLSQLRRSPILSADQAGQLAIREAFAWHAAGQTDRAAQLLVEFTSQSLKQNTQVGDRSLPQFDDIQAASRWLTQFAPPTPGAAALESGDWLTPRGNSSGAIQVQTMGPIGGPAWRASPLALAAAELSSRDDLDAEMRLEQELERAEAPLRDAEKLLWTTTTPLVVNDLVIFRTPRDIVALDQRTADLRWRSVLTDSDFETLWNGELTRQERINLPATSPVADYLAVRLYEDRTFGSLSSDGRFVYALEGLGYYSQAAAFNAMQGVIQAGEGVWSASNHLTAYEIAGGRLAWEIGGDRDDPAGDFAGHFFLGPPIAVENQLLLLAEVQGEVRLIVLEAGNRGARKIWSQPLAAPSYKITEEDDRRRMGLMPAYAEGIAICPTGAGVAIAVDLVQRRLLWAYLYPSTSAGSDDQAAAFAVMLNRQNMPMPTTPDDSGWQDSTPVIAAGRVFLTPADSDELHCVQLSDGKLLWKTPRGGAAYLAGADAERAVTIAPGRIESWEASTGLPAWAAPLQVPAVTGRGVWQADRYLAPLATGEIASIDLASGRMLARSKLPEGRLPGHLAAGAGALVSLSSRDVLSFRSQGEIEQFLADRLAADPEDPGALALRGEARLHRGEHEAGLADLRTSVARQPEAYAKSVLAAALLEGLRHDFSAHRDAIAELDSLTDDPGQRNEFLWLVARGLRKAGDRQNAFDRMLPLMEQSLDEITADGVGSPWTARTDRRLAGHFAALYRDATPAEQAAFDQSIAERLPPESDESDAQIKSYRRFLRTFDFHPQAIAARQKLIALLDPDSQGLEFAWQASALADSPDAAIAAPAAGTLAKWHLARMRYDDVTAWLAVLEGRLADAECEPGVTGKQLAAQLREDAGYVAHGKEFAPWPAGQVEAQRNGQPNHNGRMIRVTLAGKAPPHYEGWSFETDPQGTMLVARDHLARQRWRLTRAASGRPQQPVFGEIPSGMHRVYLFDHLVGWSAGTDFLIAADLEPEHATPKILWQDTLLPPGADPAAEFAGRIIRLPRGGFARRRVMVPSPPTTGGELVAITRSAVLYHNGHRLIAAEPLTGKLLWSRSDLHAGNLTLTAADDDSLLMLETTREGETASPMVRRLRAIDGETLPSVTSPQGIVEWIGGSRVVRFHSARGANAPKMLELFDVETGEPVWQAELATSSVIRLWNQTEIYAVEESRRLTVRNVADGAIRWTQELDLQVPVNAVFVQRWKDRALIVLGSTTPAPAVPGSARALGFSATDVPIAGYVVAVEHATGKLLWQRAINDLPTEPTVFDPSQPPGWPVLAFAGRLIITPEQGAAAPIVPRLTATLIDKETGKVPYAVEEPSNVGAYFFEADPDRNRLTANFMAFSVELHYTGRAAK